MYENLYMERHRDIYWLCRLDIETRSPKFSWQSQSLSHVKMLINAYGYLQVSNKTHLCLHSIRSQMRLSMEHHSKKIPSRLWKIGLLRYTDTVIMKLFTSLYFSTMKQRHPFLYGIQQKWLSDPDSSAQFSLNVYVICYIKHIRTYCEAIWCH